MARHWWSRISASLLSETPAEGVNNYNWTHVQGFRDQQVKSRRAIVLPEAKTKGKNLKVGDVVVIDFGDDGEWNHSFIVTESSENGRFVSGQTATRHNVSWNEVVTENIPYNVEIGIEKGEWKKMPGSGRS